VYETKRLPRYFILGFSSGSNCLNVFPPLGESRDIIIIVYFLRAPAKPFLLPQSPWALPCLSRPERLTLRSHSLPVECSRRALPTHDRQRESERQRENSGSTFALERFDGINDSLGSWIRPSVFRSTESSTPRQTNLSTLCARTPELFPHRYYIPTHSSIDYC